MCANLSPVLLSLSLSQDFPLIFHGVAGSDERQDNGTSLFNMAEVDVVVGYFKKIVLRKEGVTNIGPQDIGIIAPYRKQVGVTVLD